MTNNIIKLKGTGLYYNAMDCLESLFFDFAKEHNLYFLDLRTTASGTDKIYYTINAVEHVVKLVKNEEGKDVVIKEWNDESFVEMFISFLQMFYYYDKKMAGSNDQPQKN